MLTHFRTLLTYEREANARVIASLRSIPEPNRNSDTAKRARGIFGHVQNARHLWLSRLGGCKPRAWVMFPDLPIDALDDDARVLDSLWQNYLAGLSDADLPRDIEYQSTDGSRFRSTIGEILTHVFNHSTYHRGQVAMLVTQSGGERASTDYIAVTRRKA